MNNAMPQDQREFMNEAKDIRKERTNMSDAEAWAFRYRVWQLRNPLREFMRRKENREKYDWIRRNKNNG